MGRGQVRNSRDPGPPSGTTRAKFRGAIFATRGIVPCYHCRHMVLGASAGELQHLISPRVRPDLQWSPGNIRIVHGGGRRRCQVCGLACNIIAASNLAPRDADGRPLPWDDAFIAARVADLERPRRAGPSAKRREIPRQADRPRVIPGRVW